VVSRIQTTIETTIGMTEAEAVEQFLQGSGNWEFDFEAGTNPVTEFFAENSALLREPTRRERPEAETELFGYAVSGHPLALADHVA